MAGTEAAALAALAADPHMTHRQLGEAIGVSERTARRRPGWPQHPAADLFPGSGAITRAWAAFTADSSASGPCANASCDSAPVPAGLPEVSMSPASPSR